MKFKQLLCACLAELLLMGLACAPALAKVVAPGDDFYYLDDADVLSEATEGEIFFSNQLLEEACGAQIVVVTLKTTGSEAIDDYAYELINDWGVGDKAKQNGFVLLMAIDDEDCYAVCGTGLQSKLTSGVLKQYLEDYLREDFFAGRYDAGAKKFFEAIFAYVAEVYDADVTTDQGIAAYEAWVAEGEPGELEAEPGGGSYDGPANRGREYEPDTSDSGLGSILLVLIVIFVVILILRSRRRRVTANYGGGRSRVVPIIFGASRPTPPPPPPVQGPYVGNQPGPGGYRGSDAPRPGVGSGGLRGNSRPSGGLFGGSTRPSGGLFGGGSSSRPSSTPAFRPSSSGSSRPSSSSRPSGGLFGGSSSRTSSSSRSGFGGARGGGGGSRGGGAGFGKH